MTVTRGAGLDLEKRIIVRIHTMQFLKKELIALSFLLHLAAPLNIQHKVVLLGDVYQLSNRPRLDKPLYKNENYNIARAMSSSRTDPVLGHCPGWGYLNI